MATLREQQKQRDAQKAPIAAILGVLGQAGDSVASTATQPAPVEPGFWNVVANVNAPGGDEARRDPDRYISDRWLAERDQVTDPNVRQQIDALAFNGLQDRANRIKADIDGAASQGFNKEAGARLSQVRAVEEQIAKLNSLRAADAQAAPASAAPAAAPPPERTVQASGPARRNSPAQVAAAAPAPAAVPAQQPAAPAAAPAVVDVAADRGVTGLPPDAPAAQQPAANLVPPEQDRPAFEYADAVKAGVDKAMSLGRPDVAAAIQREYADLVVGQFQAMEAAYEMDTLPQVKAMQKELLNFQNATMPEELKIRARDLAMRATQQQQQMLAYAYGLERNGMTAGAGVQLFNRSQLIEPGMTLDHLGVHGKDLVGLDKNGQVVNFSSGQPFVIPIAHAEELYNTFYGQTTEDAKILPEGSMMVDGQGRVLRQNPKAADGPSSSDQLSSVKLARDIINETLGIKLDATGQMIENVGAATREQAAMLAEQAGALVRSGMTPEQAAATVLRQSRAAGIAEGDAPGPSLKGLIGGSN